MISKASSTKGSIQAIQYIMDDKGQAKELSRNLLSGITAKDIFAEFKEVQKKNIRCKKKTYSIVLSPSKEVSFTKDQLMIITKEHLKNLHLENHPWIAYLHQSTAQPHVHIIANRINLDGKAHNDSFISKKAQNSAQKIAQTLGLKTAKELSKERRKSKDLSNGTGLNL